MVLLLSIPSGPMWASAPTECVRRRCVQRSCARAERNPTDAYNAPLPWLAGQQRGFYSFIRAYRLPHGDQHHGLLADAVALQVIDRTDGGGGSAAGLGQIPEG